MCLCLFSLGPSVSALAMYSFVDPRSVSALYVCLSSLVLCLSSLGKTLARFLRSLVLCLSSLGPSLGFCARSFYESLRSDPRSLRSRVYSVYSPRSVSALARSMFVFARTLARCAREFIPLVSGLVCLLRRPSLAGLASLFPSPSLRSSDSVAAL